MKALIGLAAAVAGYLYLRRTRPGAVQKLEGRAKTMVGDLTGRSDLRAEGRYDEAVGGVRETAHAATST
jgi:uncharacterized protein YjbJ (UPF0337 family)